MSASSKEGPNQFANRKSPAQRDTIALIEKYRSKVFVPVRSAYDTQETLIGYTNLFFHLLEFPKFLQVFCDLVSTETLSKASFVKHFAPFLCAEFQDDEVLCTKFTRFVWDKILSEGTMEDSNVNAVRVAFSRLRKEHPRYTDELGKAHEFAENMRIPHYRKTELQRFQALCQMLLSSETVFFSFFKFVDNLKGKLAETLTMNFPFTESFDVRQETMEMFIRNQLLQFAKCNHHSHASSPKKIESCIILFDPVHPNSEDLVASCKDSAKSLRAQIYGNYKLFDTLRTKALTDITSSETSVSKTTLRKWANQVLKNDGIVIKNSYDLVFCKLLNFLGSHFNFSVRGSYQYAISIKGIEETQKRPKRVYKAAPTDPLSAMKEMDAQLIEFETSINKIKKSKRALEKSEIYQEHLKRQRAEEESSED